MNVPARLRIIIRLAAIDPVLAQEIAGQLFQAGALNLFAWRMMCKQQHFHEVTLCIPAALLRSLRSWRYEVAASKYSAGWYCPRDSSDCSKLLSCPNIFLSAWFQTANSFASVPPTPGLGKQCRRAALPVPMPVT